MKKILALLILAALLFSGYGAEEKDQISESPSGESSLEETSNLPKEELPEEETSQEADPNEENHFYDMYFDFDIPEFPDADTAHLEFNYLEMGWCVEGTAFPQREHHEQLFCNDETAQKLAEAIAFADYDFRYNREVYFSEFENIEEADMRHLIYVFARLTPSVAPTGVTYYGNKDGKPVLGMDDAKHPENVIYQMAKYLWEEHEFVIAEAYYIEDVEKTFHYLFGDELEFVPQDVHNGCIRYIPEAGIFAYPLEGMDMFCLPQIISYGYNAEEGRYYAEAVNLMPFDYNEEGKVTELTKEDILAQTHYNYIFSEAADGRLILEGIKEVK